MFQIYYDNDGQDSAICNLMDELESISVGKTRVVAGWAVTRWSEEAWEAGTWGQPDRALGKETMAEALASSTNAAN